MTESADIERVVATLKKVPEKRLLIIDLANRIPMKEGQLDYDAVATIQPEVNMANADTAHSKRRSKTDPAVEDDIYEFKRRVGTKGLS